jgi:hypothetical protein
MLLAAVDFRPDHLKRVEKRLDGVGTASRIRALPIGPDDFPPAMPPPLSSVGQKTWTGTPRAAPRTFVFKLRVIAFIFKTPVAGFGGRRGSRHIALPPAAAIKAAIPPQRKALIPLRIEQFDGSGKFVPFDLY